MPQRFPIPLFHKSTEKKLADDDHHDRKYMVRVLATMLTTYVQCPSIKHCQMVAESLILKFSFLKESVSQNLQFFLLTFNLITIEFLEAFHIHKVSEH